MNIKIAKKASLNDIKIVAKEAVKKANIDRAQVVCVFDVSGSMTKMYRDGTVKALATRVLALAMQLDDDGVIPVYALDNNCQKVGDLTEDNLEDFVEAEIAPLVGGGTEYAPSINEVVKDAREGDDMLVILFTDGANDDRADSRDALINASKLPIFFQFFGIYEGSTEPAFDFLHKMDEMKGRMVDNAGFSPLGLQVVDSSKSDGDKELYEAILHEYQFFPQKATQANVTWKNLPEVHKDNPRHKLFGIF